MKKLGLIAMAMALVMTLSQCKKDDTTTPTNDGKKVPITLKVSSNGAKHEVTPSTGEVTFQNGDVLHVASNGVYLGTLEYNNSVFSGEINMPTEGLPLHFYFLGNVTPEFNPNNTECSVVISDQTTNLPVISYNTSKENYETGKTNYNARLLNQCALVKFEVTSSVPNSATSIMGMNNRVTVTFGSDEFGYDQVNDGKITLPAGEGERWAILLPQNEVARAVVRSADEMWEGSCGTIPAIAINDYLTNGIAAAISHPTGAINSLFSVSTSEQVYFSKGNLQYIGSAATPYWKFADNQWDILGDNGQGSSSPTANRDLFGWGTSGWNNGNTYYRPYNTAVINYGGDQGYGYGPTNGTSYLYDLTGDYAEADWAWHNAISNGGDAVHQWRTLTKNEWNYVFNERTTTSGIRYAKAIVNNVKGIILLPDDWNTATYALNNTNTASANYASNNITATDWTDVLEDNGAVFLPAADYRNKTDIQYVNFYGLYWSSSHLPSDTGYAYCLYLSDYEFSVYDYSRELGLSVRPVQDYN